MFTMGEVVGAVSDGVGENGSATGGTVASAVFAGAAIESSCFGVRTDAAGLGDLIFTGTIGADDAGFVNAGAAEFDGGVCGGADFLSRNECIAAMTSGV